MLATTRRSLLAAFGVVASGAVIQFPSAAWADEADPRLSERGEGKPDARVTVIEYFSLTCPHCARFYRDVMPRVRAELIETGQVRVVYRDFPLDQTALTAAMIARALPSERYEAFIGALFASQDRWAFDRSANTTEQLWKLAALAGMTRKTFDATIADERLRTAILTEQKQGEDTDHVDSTPTFIIGGERHAGELSFEAFAKLVSAAQS
jgi:protein-disulfide isomerase